MRLRVVALLSAVAMMIGALPISAAATSESPSEKSSDEPVFGWSNDPVPADDEADSESADHPNQGSAFSRK